ncbi:D-tyrosyl-tRNA(Tyr) deacylase [Nonlabens sp. Hel1_33_55]|uniref:D-aminoacyl-tRNA deacylase n=1 Tax=Nonlabens sp. Hel1_33_55 TaxID=1336802 RepID=UPI000875B1C1|nr:D-aminoacyl-tRNA deacylase [Nonlabens sp. Hel1_33_55]SCY43710.1 D-tyrosyl-tRNA(Tyr) deacylase [Nonlabens sp. Hel1_33_55]
MRVVVQRVSNASVHSGGQSLGSINRGLLVLIGITATDSSEDIEYLVRKICGLRIFTDKAGKMNLSIGDIDGDILVVSQFTLYAQTKKGNRPSYINAAKPEVAIPLYEAFVSTLSRKRNKQIPTGTFGADMQVRLVNDGPVTIIIDSKED